MTCDEKTFGDIFEKHKGIIYKVSMLYTQTREDQEDLFQDICFQICRSYSSFHEKAKISTWIYRVALNTAISRIRKDRKKSSEEIFYENIHNSQNRNDPGQSQSYLLFQAISKLNRIDKALMMLWLEEKSYDEIGEILGISKSNVSVKLVRIKKGLSKTINGLEK